MTVEDLNKQVTDAILEAELSEAKGDPPRVIAHRYLTVSEIEEKLAALLPVTTDQGAIARRGVVRAALRARAWARARYWAHHYAEEPDAPEHLVSALDHLAREADQAIAAIPGSTLPQVARVRVVDISSAA
jgi:hypothetical protein